MFANDALLTTWTPRAQAGLRILAGSLFLRHATAKGSEFHILRISTT